MLKKFERIFKIVIIFSCLYLLNLFSSDSVSVIFSVPIVKNGIEVKVGPNSGAESIKNYAGKTGLETNILKEAGVIYCDIDDKFIYDGINKVLIKVEYWDKKVNSDEGFYIAYDSVGEPRVYLPKIYFEGTNTWKKIEYYVDNAKFANRQNGADLRVFSPETDICIRNITIEKVPEKVPIKNVEIVPSSIVLIEGKSFRPSLIINPYYATDKIFKWSSDNPKVATVNSDGVIVAVTGGNTIVRAVSRDGKFKAECNVKVISVKGKGILAERVNDFLDSIGINTSISTRGEIFEKTIECIKYTGIRWIRGMASLDEMKKLNKETGVKFTLPLIQDINKLIKVGRELAKDGILLGFEGPNEPNNWGFTYRGEKGGGHGANTWVPIAKFQRDSYGFIKSDPELKRYPVWNLSEGGAEVDNVGLQFLTIPEGVDTIMSAGTQYADYANCHNYACHPTLPALIDNQAWYAADPVIKAVPEYEERGGHFDGLFKNYGETWLKKYKGYKEEELKVLPRVTTETGITIDESRGITEEIQGLLYLHIYLSQYKRGWRYTSIYILRDRSDETGNQTFGFYRPDYSPRKAAHYLHNLTSILKDEGKEFIPGGMGYEIEGQNEYVHDLLLQKSDGRFYLIIWNERFGSKKEDEVVVKLSKRYKEIKIYDVVKGIEPVEKLKETDTIKLKLKNSPLIVEI
ncbi:MAG TPA: Ig-like domain-containing protein [bacterium]|nr:Ig-like domain-containing protein [bacterium]